MQGAQKFASTKQLVDLLKKQAESNKPYGAICASPAHVLEPHGLLKVLSCFVCPNEHMCLLSLILSYILSSIPSTLMQKTREKAYSFIQTVLMSEQKAASCINLNYLCHCRARRQQHFHLCHTCSQTRAHVSIGLL